MRLPTVPEALRDTPFTTAQAAQHGLTRGMLAGPAWRQVLRGVYVHAAVADSRSLRAAAAALLVEPGVFLCGRSAAWLHGVDVHRWQEAVPSIEVGCHNGRRVRRRAGWTVREITVSEANIVQVDGIAATDPLRTCFDCIRWLPLVEAVVVVDALTRHGLTSAGKIAAYARSQRGIRNVRRVPGVLALCDSRAESPQESRLRLLMALDGLFPVPQYEVRLGGMFIARLDFAFVAEKVAIEYDGEHHLHTAAADEARRAALERLGWKVIRVYAEDLRTEARRRALISRIRGELLVRR